MTDKHTDTYRAWRHVRCWTCAGCGKVAEADELPGGWIVLHVHYDNGDHADRTLAVCGKGCCKKNNALAAHVDWSQVG